MALVPGIRIEEMQGMADGTVKIQLVRSPVGRPEQQRRMVRGLGLIRLQQIVERPDNPSTWGVVKKIPHLVKVVESK
jgi:large subunit ribosomal protein L30